MGEQKDLIIVGSGPAGLAAAIYAQRARLDSLVIEKEMMSGGQVLTTYEVDNYPGLPGIGGFDLGMKLREHADQLGAAFLEAEVQSIEKEADGFAVACDKETLHTRTVILATGAMHRKLGIPGEEKLCGMGVSYCATCDGAFFKNKVVAVIGGGDVALEDAIFLSRLCQKVVLIHRRDEFRGAKSLQHQVEEASNIEILFSTAAKEIHGEDHVIGLTIEELKTGTMSELPVDGVFIAVGITPNSQAFTGLADMEHGYLIAGEDGVTSTPGIFAVGDVRTKQLRQIVTAVSDGANAVTSVERYLNS